MSFGYNRSGEVVEIIIRDFSGAKIETFKFHINDKATANKIMNLIYKKYGFEPTINPKEIVNEDRDIDWLKKGKW